MDIARLVGITGGIGAGKSVVSRMLRLKGFEVYDCDSEAKKLMDGDPSILAELRGRFGKEIVGTKGIDRKKLAAVVFADKVQLGWLNRLVHQAVRNDLFQRCVDSSTGDVMFVESAIMVSSGLYRMCDEIWVVDAAMDLRLKRAIARDGLSPQEVTARINSQAGELEFPSGIIIRRVDNSGMHSLLRQVDGLLSEIK